MSKPLVVEIHGTGTYNRGAELMAIAISEQLRVRYPNIRIVVPAVFGSRDAITRHGFRTTWEKYSPFRKKIQSGVRKIFPLVIARTALAADRLVHRIQLGLQTDRTDTDNLDPRQIDVVLDASGFAFGDQWGYNKARLLYERMELTDRRGKPLILMPQAFGPFHNPQVAKWARRLIGRSSICFARDRFSFEAANQLGSFDKIVQCTDFTPLVNPVFEASNLDGIHYCAVVPNIRMIDKGGNRHGYLDFLKSMTTFLSEQGERVVFLIHDANEDRQIVEMLGRQGMEIESYSHADPRVLKYVLGKARFVVASRFHALVSTMSQNVPCIGVGWSHKYPELFNDFAVPEFLVPNVADIDYAKECAAKLLDSEQRSYCQATLAIANQRLKDQIDGMWQQIFKVIDTTINGA